MYNEPSCPHHHPNPPQITQAAPVPESTKEATMRNDHQITSIRAEDPVRTRTPRLRQLAVLGAVGAVFVHLCRRRRSRRR